LPHSDASFTGSISRDHFVAELPGTPPTLCLVGGKWTTFRAFGEQAADKALPLLGLKRRVDTRERAIGGGVDFPGNETAATSLIVDLASAFGITTARARHVIDHYGTGARAVLDFCRAST